MAVLKNARHERFAQELAKGQSQTDAYVAAGYKANRSAAHRLASDVNICGRLAEIAEKVQERTEVTAADITMRLLAIATKAEKSTDAPMLQAARASLMDVAKLNGLIIDKAELLADLTIRPTIIEFVSPDAGED